MKLTVKTLGGVKFPVEVEESQTIKQVKEKIKEIKSWEVPAQKLIHKGKILVDDKTVGECSISDGEFLVCVVAKAKAKPAESKPSTSSETAPAASAPASSDSGATAAAPAAAPSTPSPAPAPSSTGATPAPAASTPQPAQTPASTSAPSAAAAASSSQTTTTQASDAPSSSAGASGSAGVDDAAFAQGVQQLKDMGFPEDQVRAALTAAYGNTERATDFLLNGIPEGVGMEEDEVPASVLAESQAAAAGSGGAAGGSGNDSSSNTTSGNNSSSNTGTGGGPLAALRQHPDFNNLRRLVQNNPAALGTVLQQLGSTDPDLLEAINANRAEFVSIMNEPIDEDASSQQQQQQQQQAAAGGGSGGAPAGGFPGGMPAGGPDVQQLMGLLQLMQQMPEEQRAQLATQMGVPPEQLQAITQMPPQAMAQLMQGMMGGGGGGGGIPPGANVVRLTQEEMAAVDRLAELGFPKQACVEAYLACDKDEQLAANYLFTNPPEPMEEDNDNGGAGGN
ncbi:UV excision repair protein RAD23-like [Hondaea fermentalgiana]|uniref:UV excision repair protein RAD23-like n=1 Tax=Hondaea fermentalgiana TaxID=2315210 RepID=A0A2R5GGA8_9STRA|nr:UV excision repair protein RAD23-like [Hondaea fermentalgiana]|eukprot:GBG29942.1 UV excision repair protein RAD23-like [Hondaea fermentalgiana]